MQSKVSEYWNQRPCNIRHSDKKVGTREYFDEVTERKYFVESHILGFADFPKYKDKTVVEVGCGIGTAAISFLQNGVASYTGIDISDVSIDIAKERLEVYGFNETGKVISGDIEEEKWGKEYFETADLVYSFGVLHHTSNIKKAMATIHQILKPGAEFKLMLYARDSWKYMCIEQGFDQFEAQSGVPIADVFTKTSATELLESCGFIDVTIDQDHIFPYKVEPYKQYKYEMEDWWQAMPPVLFRGLEKKMGWHLCITCRKP